MNAAQQTSLLKNRQISPNGFFRHTQQRGNVSDRDPSLVAKTRQNFLVSVIRHLSSPGRMIPLAVIASDGAL
jgi:hypothetical protein